MTPDLLSEIEAMLNELESSQLEVMLVPQRTFTNHGGMVRVAVSRNVKWYRDFCGRFPSSRVRKNCAFDTRIKRRDVLRVLRGALAGRSVSSYVPALLGVARARIQSPALQAARARIYAGGGA